MAYTAIDADGAGKVDDAWAISLATIARQQRDALVQQSRGRCLALHALPEAGVHDKVVVLLDNILEEAGHLIG